MRAFRTLMFAAMVEATTACADNAIKGQAASPAVETPSTSATVAISQPNVPPAPVMPPYKDAASTTGTAAEASDAAATEDPNQAELNAADIYSQKLVPDPWEGFDRKMHSFNNAADKVVLRRLPVGYKKITPEPVQASGSRFLANLGLPVMVVNQALG